MMTINIDDAQSHLKEIIVELAPGEPMVITQDGTAIATLKRAPRTRWPCKAGSAKDTPHAMSPDFDAPLDAFQELME